MVLAAFCPWPKTLPDFLMLDPRFTGISDSSPRMAEEYRLRPCRIRHNFAESGRAAVLARFSQYDQTTTLRTLLGHCRRGNRAPLLHAPNDAKSFTPILEVTVY